MRETLRAIFEPKLKEGLGKIQPLTPEGTELLIEGFLTYLDGTLKDFTLLSTLDLKSLDRETLLKKLSTNKYIDWLSIQYLRYIDYRKKITETYQESKSWGEVFNTHVYEYSEEAQESFIDAIEEKYQTKVKDAKHLSKLTGITELYNYWDKIEGFLTDEEAEALAKKTKRPLKSFKATPEQSRAEALRQLQDTLINSRSAKYHRALEVAIKSGAKYKELLDIEPKDYGLTTEPWQDYGRNTKKTSVLMTIGDAFLIHEPGGLMIRPSLRAIAEELDAPYSVLMEAYKLMR